MTAEERAWIAGLLEGEGCFGWSPLRGGRDEKIPLIQLIMTDRDVVERYAQLVGNSVGVKTRPAGRKTAYRVRTQGVRAIQLMAEVYPLMGDRRKAKIDKIALSYYGQAGIDAWNARQQRG